MARKSRRKPKANPVVYQHPDMFVGESPVRVSIDNLTYDQLKRLPRSNFTDEEWEELSYDLREDIYQADRESQGRIEYVADVIRQNLRHLVELDSEYGMSEAETGIDEQLRDVDSMLSKSKKSGDYEALRKEFVDGWQQDDEFEEAFDEAMKEVLSDWNMFRFDIEPHQEGYGHSSSDLIYVPIYTYIHIAWHNELDKEVIDGIHYDEVERMFDEVLESGYDDHISVDEVYDSLKSGWKRHKHSTGVGWVVYMEPFEKHFPAVAAITGELNTEAALLELQDLIIEDEFGVDDYDWTQDPPEERIIYRFDDDFYVLRLTPEELSAEGKAMRMCVGRDDMGYKEAVRDGDIWILSLRTPAGRPKFTFEVGLEGGKPTRIKQIKGKANRLPGFDLGKEPTTPHRAGLGISKGGQKMKLDEVSKIMEVVRSMGIDPKDVYDLGPAILHLRAASSSKGPYDKTQYEEVNDLMELLGTPMRNNPMRQPLRGERPRSFDMPYRRI